MRGLMGTFAMMPLDELLPFLARRRVTGAVTCERGTVKKTVYLLEGVGVGASSNDPREFLGQLLMNFGHISEEQLTKAFQTQEETRIRLGKVLTMVGLVDGETVRQVLAIKIRETLLDAFIWDSGVFYVEDTPTPPPDEYDPAVPLDEVVREAEFRATAWQAFRTRFPSGAATLLVNEIVAAAAAPGSVEARVLAMAREGKTIDEIGLALHATDFHLYQRLYALGDRGALAAAPVRPPTPGAGEEAVAASELAERARQLLEAGRHDEAESLATQAVDLAPSLEPARTALADAQRALSAQLRAWTLDPPRTPALKLEAHEIALLRLSAAEKYLLSRCDGVRNLREIVQIAPLREIEVLKAFKRFTEARIVELKLVADPFAASARATRSP